MIKLGTNNIGKIYLGSNSIGKAYLGSNLVFQKGSSPTPSIQPVFYTWLVFDGTAYIQTDLYVPTDGSITVGLGYESIKASQSLFGQAGEQVGMALGVYLGPSTTTTTRSFICRYKNTNSVQNLTLLFSYSAYGLFLTPNNCGISTPNSITKGSLACASGLYIGKPFGAITQAYSGRVGYVRIYDSTVQNLTSYSDFATYTPTYTLRPCTYDGESGMWCVETNTFYGNMAGAGTFSVVD